MRYQRILGFLAIFSCLLIWAAEDGTRATAEDEVTPGDFKVWFDRLPMVEQKELESLREQDEEKFHAELLKRLPENLRKRYEEHLELKKLAQDYLNAPVKEQPNLRKELLATLTDKYFERMERSRKRLERANRRLEELEKDFEERRKNAGAIIEAQLDRLLKEAAEDLQGEDTASSLEHAAAAPQPESEPTPEPTPEKQGQ